MTAPSYDALPYADYCFPRTHPEHLFTMARLLGHSAPDFRAARVLELGCAAGANLLPMAMDLPDAHFVGIDLSERQIEIGCARIAQLGPSNITLEARSIVDVGTSLGTFDYVLCHGVYSWVPAFVQTAILALCRTVLSPKGLAYVSYNTFPGWSTPRTVRDFLRMQTGERHSPTDRIRAARTALALLIEALGRDASPHAVALRTEAQGLVSVDDAYLFHEYLTEVNEPVYFTDFVRAARMHGLDHLVDADPAITGESGMAALTLDPRAADPIALEQTLDILRNRRFRASILVHHEEIHRRPPTLADLQDLAFATRAELTQDATEASLRTHDPLRFELDGRTLEPRDPVAKSALATLAAAERRPVPWNDLARHVSARSQQHDAHALAACLVPWIYQGTVIASAGAARYSAEGGITPAALRLAREQAREGTIVTNGRHQQLELGAFERTVLVLADGTRDRSALAHELQAAIERRDLPAPEGTVMAACEEALTWLAVNALLVA